MATKPPTGGTKTSPSKPVAKTTVPTPPPTPVSSPTPTTTAVPNSSVATAAVYVSKPTPMLKKHWMAIGIIIVVVLVFLCGLALGGVFKKTPPAETRIEDPGYAKTVNPSRTFFSGVLVCPANEWSETVYIRENLKWSFPLGVPYVYMLDDNGQEIPCDGIQGADISGNRVNSIKFKYRVKKVLVVEQVPFEKQGTPVEKK